MLYINVKMSHDLICGDISFQVTQVKGIYPVANEVCVIGD